MCINSAILDILSRSRKSMIPLVIVDNNQFLEMSDVYSYNTLRQTTYIDTYYQILPHVVSCNNVVDILTLIYGCSNTMVSSSPTPAIGVSTSNATVRVL
ncbi:MAG: hypothetical protein [Circular genetic element sp.]|nr:MAG: hypothetical protein [Circular genetic element sp.]